MRFPLLPANPFIRSLLGITLLALALISLRTNWGRNGSGTLRHFNINSEIDTTVMWNADLETHQAGDSLQKASKRQVFAHFMLGNTYPFTVDDWTRTFDLAEKIGLDALVLNVGPEDWQITQANAAYKLASSRLNSLKSSERPIRLLLSLDMNVLPCTEWTDANSIVNSISGLLELSAQITRDGRPLLSTFSGHTASFGGRGWAGLLDLLNKKLAQPVSFWPTFFMPPDDFLQLPFVDGTFAWNNGWPMGNHTISLDEDEPFLASVKPYMAAVSPLFSTHYGSEGEWAFNKNWIYRSDDLLYPSRWAHLISLPDSRSPEYIQVISWNDYGESHALAPVIGAEPGSQAWTLRMDHVAFLEMTAYYTARWRDGIPEVSDQVVLWTWYRTQPKSIEIPDDAVGRPGHADWAQDLINAVVLVPTSVRSPALIVNNKGRHKIALKAGRLNALTIPFKPGPVTFEIQSNGKLVLRGAGHMINGEATLYNFNMWSGAWRVNI